MASARCMALRSQWPVGSSPSASVAVTQRHTECSALMQIDAGSASEQQNCTPTNLLAGVAGPRWKCMVPTKVHLHLHTQFLVNFPAHSLAKALTLVDPASHTLPGATARILRL
jgi:hypothetical protein